jgi:HAD superfamily hydrolase (TIGR01509 family)
MAVKTPLKDDKTPRAVLFDFDGTMGRTLHVRRDAYRASLAERGIELEAPELINNCFHRCQREVVKSLAISDPEIFKESIWARVRARMDDVEPYPGLLEALQEIRNNGFKTGIVTNSRRANVEPILERWNIRELFDALITIDDVANGKPDPEPVHHAINRLNVSPSDTFFVGDWDSDVHAAGKAGAKSIAFSPAENHEFLSLEELLRSKPTFVVESYTALRELILHKPSLPKRGNPLI